MVMPMSMPTAQMDGPPTPEMLMKLKSLKYVVIVLGFAAVGRLATGDVPFGDFIAMLDGIFLLKDDETFRACHQCLMGTFIGQCAGPSGGGLSCVMPFGFISAMNCVFMLGRILSGGPFIIVSFITQLVGAFLAYQLFRIMRSSQEGMASGQAQPLNQPFSGFSGIRNSPQPSDGGGAASGGEARDMTSSSANFVAFQGGGNRLGD